MGKGKLVRDTIIKIMKKEGKKPHYKILEEVDYEIELKKKLVEEAKEVLEAKNIDEMIEEIADVQEVIKCLKRYYSITPKEVQEVQTKKRKSRGSFFNKIFLFSK